MSDRGAMAAARAFYELLTEEQRWAQRQMAHRRNAVPAAIDELVARVFYGLGPRMMEILGGTPTNAERSSPESGSRVAGVDPARQPGGE